MLTVGSLFSGIGGIDLGLERAGMRLVWQVEVDGYCAKILEKHWPGVARFGDVRECGRHNLVPVDLVCGGFPCQPASVAGKRQGTADGRWLWPEFYRIICELRPRWVLVENVSGLLSVNAGRAFGGILRDLAEGGYDAEWDCIPASAFGAPHVRDRLWLVAYPARIGPSATGDTRKRRAGLAHDGCHVPDADGERCQEQRRVIAATAGFAAAECRGGMAYADGEPLVWTAKPRVECDHWQIEPGVGRLVDGFPGRMDRIRALGNAVVPQVAEWIGRRILEAEERAHA